LSQRPVHSISAVLEALVEDFPNLTISKLRYLEDQGLLTPERTPSGYRRYSEADLERVAWVLIQQRDNFLPLRVIRQRLAAMDELADSGTTPPPRPPRPARLEGSDVAALTGQDPARVAAVAEAAGASASPADASLIDAVEAVAELEGFGLDLRHLKPVFQAARRSADLVELAVAAGRGPGSAGAERAAAQADQCARALASLSVAVLRLHIAGLGTARPLPVTLTGQGSQAAGDGGAGGAEGVRWHGRTSMSSRG
jgi:DNA-binding transcriptional MerR regulator